MSATAATPQDEGDRRYKHSTKKRGSFYNRCAPGQMLLRKEEKDSAGRTFRLCKTPSASVVQRKTQRTSKVRMTKALERCKQTLPYYSVAELEAAIAQHKVMSKEKQDADYWKGWSQKIKAVEKEIKTPKDDFWQGFSKEIKKVEKQIKTPKAKKDDFWKGFSKEIKQVEKQVKTPKTKKDDFWKGYSKEIKRVEREANKDQKANAMLKNAFAGLQQRFKTQKAKAAKATKPDGDAILKQAIEALNEQFQAQYEARPTSAQRLEANYKQDYREITGKSPTQLPWKKTIPSIPSYMQETDV
jgi:hypothetical protein